MDKIYFTQQELKTALEAKGIKDNTSAKPVIDSMVKKGVVIEGYNDTPKQSVISEAFGDIKQIGTDFEANSQKRFGNIEQSRDAYKAGTQGLGSTALQILGQAAGAGADAITSVGKAAVNLTLSDKSEKAVTEVMEKFGSKVMNDPRVQEMVNFYNSLPEERQRNIDAYGGIIDLVSNFVGGGAVSKAKNVSVNSTKQIINTTKKTLSDIKLPPPDGGGGAFSGIIQTGQVINTGEDILKNATKNVVADTKNIIGKTGESIKGIKTPDLFPVDAPENIKTSLNPFLTNTKAEISVPTKDGFILKTIDKVTPSEKQAVQKQTSNLYNTMLKRAEEFKVDRRDILSPLEVVGQNTDKALSKVDKLRQNAGKVMGEIEKLNTDTPIELKGTRLNTLIDEYLGSNKKYGRTFKDTSFLNDFVKDFDKLSQNPTAKETLDFTRTWTNELENLKDGFGQFKDNKRTYTLIEGALGDIKNNTRNFIAEANPEYKNALAQYRLTSQIKEEGNRLLGKEGLSGERIKGGALAKRSVQSSSDAGARQFYNTLKQTVGYDGLKEADIALQAMKDAGDYQGLSLLEVNKDLYNATVGNIVKKIPGGEAVLETAKVVSSKMYPQSKRINKLIQK